MKNKLIIVIFSMLFVVFTGCEDLIVEDLNHVKLKDVYSDPNVFPAFIEGAAVDYWRSTGRCEGSVSLAAAAQTFSSSFTNMGGQDFNMIPRIAFANTTTYKFRYAATDPWQYLNAAIVKINTILKIVDGEYGGRVLNSEGVDITNRIKCSAYFFRGICMGNLGITYDKAFIVRPETEEIVFSPYSEVMKAAIEDLEACISIAKSDNTVINSGWNGVTLNAGKIAQVASTYRAKFEAIQARDDGDVNNLVDWNKVKTFAEQGLNFDFYAMGDGNVIWDNFLFDRGQRGTSSRVSQWLIKLMNPTLPESVVPYPWPDGVLKLPQIATPVDKRVTTDFLYNSGNVPFSVSRGYWYFSSYSYNRYAIFRTSYATPMPILTAAENDLLLAEALVRTNGDKTLAATLINKTRVDRGGLTALTSSNTNAELLRAITYERLVEFSWIGGFGNGYFYRRIASAPELKLMEGTFLHLPIPAVELELLGEEVYTFGPDKTK